MGAGHVNIPWSQRNCINKLNDRWMIVHGKSCEKDLKQQQSKNKAFWNHFEHFGRLLGKMYLFLTPSKTDGRVHSQQGAPTTYNLIYWEFSQHTCVQTLLASLGVLGVVKARKSVFQWGLGRGQGRNSSLHLCVLRGGRCFRQIAHSSYPRHRIPWYTLHYLFPSNTFL